MMRRIVPLFWFGPAINNFRQGEIGWGVTLLCMSAFFIIVNAVFDDIAERDREKRQTAR
jgi:hypothetical protein